MAMFLGSYAMFVVVMLIAKSFDFVMFNILLRINIYFYTYRWD